MNMSNVFMAPYFFNAMPTQMYLPTMYPVTNPVALHYPPMVQSLVVLPSSFPVPQPMVQLLMTPQLVQGSNINETLKQHAEPTPALNAQKTLPFGIDSIMEQPSPPCKKTTPTQPKSLKVKTRVVITPEITKTLNDWLMANIKNPYPNEAEAQALMKKTNITRTQLRNWFINRRRDFEINKGFVLWNKKAAPACAKKTSSAARRKSKRSMKKKDRS